MSTITAGQGITVVKRNGTVVPFDRIRIERAILKASAEAGEQINPARFVKLYDTILLALSSLTSDADHRAVSVEAIQDIVERSLMSEGLHNTAKTYILYRERHRQMREVTPVSDADVAAIEENRKYFTDEIQLFQMISKYARWREDLGRRETWVEVCERVINYFKWHMQTYFPSVSISETEWQELYHAMLNLEAFPSMRMMQMAGPAARRCQVSIFNCAFNGLNSIDAFVETLYVLMQGTGCGFSVESDFIEDLPKIKKQKGEQPAQFKVEDSTEGWCEALRAGLTAWFSGEDVVFDFSAVRPAGARLKTKGGRASGPGPLKELLDFARSTILSRQGRRLRSIDAHDIACMIGKIVQVGGVRRAAMISYSDLDDDLMRHAKDGAMWWETTPRAMSNNSAVYLERPSDMTFMTEWFNLAKSGSGERGLFNYSGIIKQMPKRRKKAVLRGNPCGEINLRSKQFCNLSIAVLRPHDTPDTIARKVKIATIFGTIQSSMTNFKYLSKEWKQNCDEEALLGVDLIGASDCPFTRPGAEKMDQLLSYLRDEVVVKTNIEMAKRMGTNPSVATTCLKPSGNSSVMLNAGNPITGWFSEYMIRRVRCNAIDPVCQLLIDAGVPHFPEYNDPNPTNPAVWVFEFPLKAPDGAMTKDHLTTIEQLERWKCFKLNWTEHNPSVTIYVGKDEWMGCGAWVLENFEVVGGIAFLPRSDHVYLLAPLEAITKEEYEKRKAEFPRIAWEKLSRYEHDDHTTLSQELACTGDKCVI